jgi:hypothetical protein
MAEVTIYLEDKLAAGVLAFIETSMQAKGKEGATALLAIIAAFEEGLKAASKDDAIGEVEF